MAAGPLPLPNPLNPIPSIRLRSGAVVVTFNPPDGLRQRLRAARAEVDRLVIVDNGSDVAVQDELDALAADPQVQVLRLGRNLGLAEAQNRGVQALIEAGAQWVLLLDHDSEPEPGMVTAMIAAAERHESPSRIGILAPWVVHHHAPVRWRWPSQGSRPPGFFRFLFADSMTAPAQVDFAIASGMLIRREAWAAAGPMRADFFIDGIDTEYCLRVRASGFLVLAVPQARLSHHLGETEQRKLLGVDAFPTHHSPLRHYYIARNRFHVLRAHGRRFPSWVGFEIASASKLAVKVICFERDRPAKLGMMLRGTWDGLRGRSGPFAGG